MLAELVVGGLTVGEPGLAGPFTLALALASALLIAAGLYAFSFITAAIAMGFGLIDCGMIGYDGGGLSSYAIPALGLFVAAFDVAADIKELGGP